MPSQSDLVARLRARTGSERIGLFGCSDEDTAGRSGLAINERDEVWSFWLHRDGKLDLEPLEEFAVLLETDPEFIRARAEVAE